MAQRTIRTLSFPARVFSGVTLTQASKLVFTFASRAKTKPLDVYGQLESQDLPLPGASCEHIPKTILGEGVS